MIVQVFEIYESLAHSLESSLEFFFFLSLVVRVSLGWKRNRTIRKFSIAITLYDMTGDNHK